MTATLILAAAILLPVAAQPMTQAKDGQCPSGYRDSFRSCAPVIDLGPPLASAQGPVPCYGPDGQVCNRGVRHAATFARRQYLVQQYERRNVPQVIIGRDRAR